MPPRPAPTVAQRVIMLAATGCIASLLSACQIDRQETATGADAAPQAVPAPQAPLPLDWQALEQALGQYPHETPFLQRPDIAARLSHLLGKQGYALALQNLQVSGPLSVEGSTYYITGNRQHQGGIEAVAITLDEASNRVRVWLLHQGQANIFSEPGADYPWPRDVRILTGETSP
ncbi:hypothetical protein AAV94_08540 [Lampropedia cohaerens]|uniref:Lipoprotein n=1 Tax=Lampropedia cohaerens TaxID=1610491 RepID=A0A0U1PYX7_9BURK|nr:hypothetical protein [Lampropedia cohaerens]KKW67686.1 hypothetical protein AAV94_08540 [Lampropedia cohaerens]